MYYSSVHEFVLQKTLKTLKYVILVPSISESLLELFMHMYIGKLNTIW